MLSILYVVRTFGPVGGMERYVYETARELALRGHQVSILCRSVDEPSAANSNVEIIQLQPKPAKRGWSDRYVFRDAVTEFFADPAKKHGFDITHSHENTIEQDVSTEHGPCTAYGLRLKPWKHFDYSARKNLTIEKQKFHGPNLKALVSCAKRVQDIALREYPHLAQKITRVITPAYTYLQPVAKDPARKARVLGFMGRDWKRKGLPKALEIFRILRREDPSWTMLIAGCPAESLPGNLIGSLPEGAEILGRTNPQDFFAQIDVLVHPATDEPFGMVMSEALTCGVPVVFSDQCGATDHLRSEGLRVLSVKAPSSDWASACSDLAGRTFRPSVSRTWSDVAVEHEDLYRHLLAGHAPAD
ncbi:MAG: glycosyltransferase family 4 protein [Chthoniobacterales bacterium]|nr:glycosyltransferase family 4 protein [Chthoniobacterales bacterium]